MSKFNLVTLLSLAATLFAGAPAAHANPNSQDPRAALASHNTVPGAESLVQSLYGQRDPLTQRIENLRKLAKTPDKISTKQLIDVGEDAWKAWREAQHLQRMREPAGHDLAPHFQHILAIAEDLGRGAVNHGSTAPGLKYKQKLIKGYVREEKKWNQRGARVIEMINKGQAEQAIVEAEKMLSERAAMDILGDHNERKRYLEPFMMNVLGPADSAIGKLREKKYKTIAGQKAKGYVDQAAAFEGQVSRLAAEIAAGSKASLSDGKQGDGPQAVTFVGEYWARAHTALVRANSILNAFSLSGGKQLNEPVKKVQTAAQAAILGIIEATGKSASENEASKLYGSLLREVSILNRRVGDQSLAKSCEPAFEKFRSTHPQLAENIKNYNRSTSELLKFRREFAKGRANAKSKGLTNLTSFIDSESSTTPKFKIAPVRFSSPASDHVAKTSQAIIKKPVSFGRVTRLSLTSLTAISKFRSNSYVNVVPLSAKDDTLALQKSLVASTDHLPLTIEAADAITSGELHDFVKGGGMVGRVQMDARVTRMITLPEIAMPLSPLGSLPTYDQKAGDVTETCWRMDVVPAWFQTEYFVVTAKKK